VGPDQSEALGCEEQKEGDEEEQEPECQQREWDGELDGYGDSDAATGEVGWRCEGEPDPWEGEPDPWEGEPAAWSEGEQEVAVSKLPRSKQGSAGRPSRVTGVARRRARGRRQVLEDEEEERQEEEGRGRATARSVREHEESFVEAKAAQEGKRSPRSPREQDGEGEGSVHQAMNRWMEPGWDKVLAPSILR
jgi:hypothetical protein